MKFVTLINWRKEKKGLSNINMARNTAILTCDLAFAHPTPQSFRFSHRPVLHLGAEAAEELVLLRVRHPSASAASGLVDHARVRGSGRSTFLGRHLPVNPLVKLLRRSLIALQLCRSSLLDLFHSKNNEGNSRRNNSTKWTLLSRVINRWEDSARSNHRVCFEKYSSYTLSHSLAAISLDSGFL